MKLRFGNVEIFPPDYTFDFMKWRKVTIGLSVITTILALLVVSIRGLNYGIDFLGGSEVTVNVTDPAVNRERLEAVAKKANVGTVEITTYGDVGKKAESYVLRIQRERGQDEAVASTKADDLIKTLKAEIGADKITVGNVLNISGKIGREEELRGYLALVLSFVGIMLYVAVRFDSRFAPGAVLCLVHDVIIALGIMTVLGKPFTVASIAAFLTIVGYSINDTVVVYDRIRETQANNPRMALVDIVNSSISQTMNRTVLTSAAGLGALIILTIFGGGAIEDFALTMFIGIVTGTYSSIYVAAPLTIVMDDFLRKRGWRTSEDDQKKVKVQKDPNFIPPVVVRKRPSK